MKVKVSKRVEAEFFGLWLKRKHNTINWFRRAEKRKGWANEEFYDLALYYYTLGRKRKRGSKERK